MTLEAEAARGREWRDDDERRALTPDDPVGAIVDALLYPARFDALPSWQAPGSARGRAPDEARNLAVLALLTHRLQPPCGGVTANDEALALALDAERLDPRWAPLARALEGETVRVWRGGERFDESEPEEGPLARLTREFFSRLRPGRETDGHRAEISFTREEARPWPMRMWAECRCDARVYVELWAEDWEGLRPGQLATSPRVAELQRRLRRAGCRARIEGANPLPRADVAPGWVRTPEGEIQPVAAEPGTEVRWARWTPVSYDETLLRVHGLALTTRLGLRGDEYRARCLGCNWEENRVPGYDEDLSDVWRELRAAFEARDCPAAAPGRAGVRG